MNLALGSAFDSNFCCTVLVPHLCSRIRVVVPGKQRALSIPVLQVRAACSNKSISANPVGWAAIPNFNLSIVLEYSESSCEFDTWQERLRHGSGMKGQPHRASEGNFTIGGWYYFAERIQDLSATQYIDMPQLPYSVLIRCYCIWKLYAVWNSPGTLE